MVQRCLYEVLGVERTADDDAIKKAYRKQALVWHPGKCSCCCCCVLKLTCSHELHTDGPGHEFLWLVVLLYEQQTLINKAAAWVAVTRARAAAAAAQSDFPSSSCAHHQQHSAA